MGAMAILRLALVFSIFNSLSSLTRSSPSPSPQLQIVNAERRGHGFKPWKQPLVEMQGKAVYNRPLWSALPRTLRIVGA